MAGKVYLVGAGPGAADLITVKGLNCLKNADVIIYDSLIDNSLLDYAKYEAEKIFVGKRAGNHCLQQEEINELLAQKAKEHKIVVRLKGGDPFVFGRGGEEAIYLKENGIEFEVVPGVSSAIAGAAYAGIPVTHRGISSSVHIINGHSPENIDFEAIAKLSGTLVFMMGVANLSIITSRLIDSGKSPQTPVAVISNATCPNQKATIGTLLDITHSETPAIIIVGEVVNLRNTISWFENKPLFDRNIVVTRAKHQNTKLISFIRGLGGNAIEFPTIEIQPVEFKIPDLDCYDWLIFTSINAIELFFYRLSDIRKLNSVKIAVVGEFSGQFFKNYRINPDFMPDEFHSEALVEGLKQKLKKEDKILFPKAEKTREVIAPELKKYCAKLDELVLYKAIKPDYDISLLKEADSVCFASPSAINNFPAGYNHLKVYCIGPITEQVAKEYGFKKIITADKYTIDGLMEKLL